ncbi:dihydroneopterin aldolase [Roseomonas haemaphysalidis]|uniref:dihydroneopterin aldolase n=1 Tax=Roseomonas haemaphysalidis TaxID=2768162 RepID=A0ABS3KVF9_9PROT|nr:dihydroneopterin aldolase [Roseomonas haemaphysalidis]MBO1081466.1 dihydroneopterin aldolase [Roseomonas haemaphysalidis]
MSGYGPDAARGLRRVFIRRLEVMARLGVYPQEVVPQRVLIDIELLVEDDAAPHDIGPDRLDRVVDYGAVADAARSTATTGHTRLAETLAERIALAALADVRVRSVRVTVEKPDIVADAAGVGVTVERLRNSSTAPQ